MADYANDVITQKKIESRNKTSDFQLRQYTDRLGTERRRSASDFDREKRMFEKRYMFLRTAVKSVARYSEQSDESKDLKNGNIRRASFMGAPQDRPVKSAAPLQRNLEEEMTGNDVTRAASRAAGQTTGDKDVFITQRASAKRGKQSPVKSVVEELEDDEAVFAVNPENEEDTWSNVGRDLQYIAGPEVTQRAHLNKTYGPKNIRPRATAPNGRSFSVSTPKTPKKKTRRPYTGDPSNHEIDDVFSYEQFNLRRPSTSKTNTQKDVSFIKHALARTKTPRLPVHEQFLGKKNNKDDKGPVVPPETQSHLSNMKDGNTNESKDSQAVTFLEVPDFSGNRSRKSSLLSNGDLIDVRSIKSDVSDH